MILFGHNGLLQQSKTNFCSLSHIAVKTEHYSYSDLMAVCRSAALMPVQSVRREELMCCSADELRPVTVEDMENALQSVKPSSNLGNRRKLVEFATGTVRKPLRRRRK